MKIIINVITIFSFNLRGFFAFLTVAKSSYIYKPNTKLNDHRK